MSRTVAGIPIPDSTMARAALAIVLAGEPDILYRHSVRTFLFGALIAQYRKLAYDAELLYVVSLFRCIGLTAPYHGSPRRFEVDSANAVNAFLAAYDVPREDLADAWRAVALHTTFGIHADMPSHTALATLIAAGMEADLLCMHMDELTVAEREAVLLEFPRGPRFKEQIIDTFAQGMAWRPATTFGTVNADILERCDPNYRRRNFCGLILGSNWKE
ncbi:phosphohydrolase [Trinickia violacea]|uniref:Phosphohydrolase n=1 Tax=Trinickia violacea TaxID=2571746 RepID=A0A4V1EIF9_9BURK|nr:phosphohydrolase [Trinickia violacea]QCP53630.1 phosphohydrolase [Trinickia violacea]